MEHFQNAWSGVFGLEIDKRGAVHVLYRGDGPDSGADQFVVYASDASGAWVTRRVSALSYYGTASLTYDVIADRLVLVTGDASRALVPAGVASAGGRITVAAGRATPFGDFAWGSPVLLTGTSPSSVGAMVAIPGAAEGRDLRVVAQSPERVLVGWAERGFEGQPGVWSAWRTYAAGGAAVFSPRVRHTSTAYDTLTGLALDARGRSYVLVQRR